MRVNQNLDINFSEFKSNLLEMLQQFHNKELLGISYNKIFLIIVNFFRFIKCEVYEDICSVIFYGRSKIKSLVFLTLDLNATSQKEILSELIVNLQDIQVHP